MESLPCIGSVLRNSHNNLKRWCFHCPHFTDKETELRGDKELAKVIVVITNVSTLGDVDTV